jgi:hypothetical protein
MNFKAPGRLGLSLYFGRQPLSKPPLPREWQHSCESGCDSPCCGCLMVVLTLPTKRATCTNYCIVLGRRSKHAGGMLESTSFFPAIFFATIIGVVVFIALSQVLLDPHE